jgi:putative ABC transport system ATP-binding protein
VILHATIRRPAVRDVLVTLLDPGRYLGELGPLFGLRRSATARAVESAVVTGYTPHDFRDLVGSGRVAEAIKRASP